MTLQIIDGDLLDQDVEVIVNAWNRNIIPWWLLLPQGVSGAIKKRAGYSPFRELAKHGPIPLGGAVATGAGKLPFKTIIHVAGIDMFWRSSERSIRDSVANAMKLAKAQGYRSIAFPFIGAGTGGSKADWVLAIMQDALRAVEFDGEVRIVRYRKGSDVALGIAREMTKLRLIRLVVRFWLRIAAFLAVGAVAIYVTTIAVVVSVLMLLDGMHHLPTLSEWTQHVGMGLRCEWPGLVVMFVVFEFICVPVAVFNYIKCCRALKKYQELVKQIRG